MADITQTGPVGLKGLKGIGQQAQQELSDYSKALRGMSGKQLAMAFLPEAEIPIGVLAANAGYGNSIYDYSIQSASQLERLQDIRALNQPWYSKLGAGVAKAGALMATTFLDGTLGLLTGVVEGVGSKIQGNSWGDSIAKIFDNEVSNGLAEVNEYLETALPNYKTQEEIDGPWYKNLKTMNFWADGVLKAMGFAVGAYLSGGAGLKSIGALKKALKLGNLSTTGAKITGSVLSAINEGRIEANHGARQFLDLEFAKIVDSTAELYGIEDQVALMRQSGATDEDIIDQLAADYYGVEGLKENAVERANAMGLTTLIGNTVLLSLNNFDTFGKLYSRGYQNAKTIAKGRVAKEVASEGLDEAGERIVKEGGEYTYNKITKKRAIARGLRHGLVEGHEEIAQAFISDTAGNMQSFDSPDAYYKALLDPNAEIETKDFLKSVTEGFVNTYGNGDRYEEFAIGAIMGILGMPTFGKVQNSDSNTWTVKGKSIGISGGLLGEIRSADKQNAEGEEAVNFMNNYVKKVQEQTGHFVRSQSFTNAMDGWAREGNAFEYKNAEDNNDFAAISRFARVGRLGDLKELVNQDFENTSTEELVKIAEFTTPLGNGEGGWRAADGSLLPLTPEGAGIMAYEAGKKRDKILSEIDKYEKAISTVKAIGNNSLNEDQVNELAWLNWKVGMFTDRYTSIKEDNKNFLSEMQRGLQSFRNGRGRGMIDENTEEGQNIVKSMEIMEDFIEKLQFAKTPLQLAALMESNPKHIEFLEDIAYPVLEDMIGIDAATFEKSINDLKDTIKIAKAAKAFNQRYKEFKEDPIKLIKNRDSMDKKRETTNQAVQEVSLKDKVSNANVSDIVKGAESGDLDLTDLDTLFSEEDNAFMNNTDAPEKQSISTGKEKVKEAQKIINTSNKLEDIITNLVEEGADPQAAKDAITLIAASKEVSESEQEFLNTTAQAYNDPSLLYMDDASMQEMSQEDIEDILSSKLDHAKSIIEQAKAIYAEHSEELADFPTEAKTIARITVEDALDATKLAEATKIDTNEEIEEVTGHDATPVIITENERQKEEKAEAERQKAKEVEQNKLKDFFNEARQEVPIEGKDLFDKALFDIISDIDTLLAKDTPIKDLGKAVKDTTSYKVLKMLVPSIDEFLNTYVTYKTNRANKTVTAFKQEELETRTPMITEEDVRTQSTTQSRKNLNPQTDSGEISGGIHNYWKPTIPLLPFGSAYKKGNELAFWTIARMLKNPDGSKRFTDAQIKRIEAVGEYLDRNGAYRRIDNGEVKVGDEVSFIIDASLNEKAGEVIILMTNKNGEVIGDVMSPNEPSFQKQLYLPAFVQKVLKEYEKAGSPQHFKSSLTTVVHKNMVGKVPYLADHSIMNTLNAIYYDGSKPTNFLLGIAATSGENARILATAGRTKRQGQSKLEKSILPPLTAKAGQPFLLMSTSSDINHYVTVPITMPPYSENTKNTALGKAIKSVLEKIPNSDNSTAIDIIRSLEELIAVKEIHINHYDDNVKVTIKPNNAEHQITIYNGPKNAPNTVEQIELGLQFQRQPFQISRKYINESYNGQDYNRMIGEVAKTNLAIGATHTISDWFTVKPIDEQGNTTKAKSPRSTGKNPNAAEPQSINITKKGVTLYVNPKTWEVTDGAKTYEGKNADRVKAKAFGIYTNQNMEKPYDTEWGYYDPVTDSFIEKPEAQKAEVPNTNNEALEETSEQLTDKISKAGLLNTEVRKILWKALTPSQQAIIANKRGPKQKQWMDALEAAWSPSGFDESKLKGSVDTFLGRKGMYRRTDGSRSVWNRERETQWLSKVLPNLSTEDHLRIVEGLESIPTDDGGYAYGKFQNGIITISDIAARGTMYHEAFHAVTHTLLTSKEYQKLFDAAVERWGDIDSIQLEENLAEDFRRFMQSEEEWYDNLEEKGYSSIRKTLSILFHKLKNLTKELSGKTPYINKLYYSINRGKYSRRHIKGFNDNARYSRIEPTIEWMQKIVNNNVNNPMVNKSRVAKNTAWGRLVDSWLEEGYLIKGYWDTKTKQWTVSSIKKANTAFNQEARYRKIEQYHRDKYLYNNLSQENKSYLQEKGISIEEFSEMTQLEKEVLFRCKH